MALVDEYKKMLTELIQKQMVVLGPNIALDKARQISGLKVTDNGAVMELAGDSHMVLKALANEYIALSEPVARMALSSLQQKYPEIPGL